MGIHVIGAVLVPPSTNVTAFLKTCPEIIVQPPVVPLVPVVPVAPFVPVVPENAGGSGGGDNEIITDQLGDLFGDLDVDDLGGTIGDAVGNFFQDPDLGEQVGTAIDNIVQSVMGLFSSDSWFGF